MNRVVLTLAALALLPCVGGQAKAGFVVYQPLTANPTAQYGYFSDGVDSGSGGRQNFASGFIAPYDTQVIDVQWYGAWASPRLMESGLRV